MAPVTRRTTARCATEQRERADAALAIAFARLPLGERAFTISSLSTTWWSWAAGSVSGVKQKWIAQREAPHRAAAEHAAHPPPPLWLVETTWRRLQLGPRQQALLLVRAAYHGDVPVLDWVSSTWTAWQHSPERWDLPAITEAAAEAGQTPVLEWARSKQLPLTAATCAAAARGGQQETLRRLHSEYTCPWDARTTAAAARGGHLGMLQWLHAAGCPCDDWTCAAAAAGGHLEVLRYLRSKGCHWGFETCAAAARGGHLEVLKYAHAQGCFILPQVVAYAAIDARQHAVLAWMCSVGLWGDPVLEDQEASDDDSEHGYFVEHRPSSENNRVIAAAVDYYQHV